MDNIVEILCCPACRGDLVNFKTFFYCKNCNVEYQIKDGIIVLISKDLELKLRS